MTHRERLLMAVEGGILDAIPFAPRLYPRYSANKSSGALPEMKVVFRQLTEACLRDGVKVIVGDTPLNEKFARDIGADGYARDAGSAVDVVKTLLNKDE